MPDTQGPGDRGEGSAAHPVERTTEVEKHVDDVIRDLTERTVSGKDRSRLGKALDTADRPETGRPGTDKAIGRISRGL